MVTIKQSVCVAADVMYLGANMGWIRLLSDGINVGLIKLPDIWG